MIALLMLAEAAAASPMPLPAFLSGCWEQRTEAGRWTEECWTDTRGGLMIGSGRSGNGETIRDWEWMRIERGADGSVTFYGSPKGAAAVGFKATESDAKSVTFVNAAHDYPQRVRYVMTETGLDAEVSLADGTNPNKWSYKRTAGAAQK
jgi:ABC-type sugar transport system substrate-binding protein